MEEETHITRSHVKRYQALSHVHFSTLQGMENWTWSGNEARYNYYMA